MSKILITLNSNKAMQMYKSKEVICPYLKIKISLLVQLIFKVKSLKQLSPNLKIFLFNLNIIKISLFNLKISLFNIKISLCSLKTITTSNSKTPLSLEHNHQKNKLSSKTNINH